MQTIKNDKINYISKNNKKNNNSDLTTTDYMRLLTSCDDIITGHSDWSRIDKGYTHDNMKVNHKNTWLYGSMNEPKAMLTIGFMKNQLLLTVRFIMVDGRIGMPNDTDMMLPFNMEYNNANSNVIISQIRNQLNGFIQLIEKTCSK